MMGQRIAGMLACILWGSGPLHADNWPQFRGADSRGVSASAGWPDRWSASENIAWKTDIAGTGWSSPVVWGDRIFLTTVVNEGESEAPRKGLYFGGDRSKPPESVHDWKVVCLALKSGEVLWERSVHRGRPEAARHIKNSYASETPVTDGERLYAYFGNVGFFCFDFNGQLLWQNKLDALKTRFGWGTAASPALHEDRLYVINDNEEHSYLAAIDAKTGDEVWRVERDEKSNWATPYIWKNHLRTEIITPGTGKTRAYDLDGNLLYEFGGLSSITIATPYEAGGLLFVSSGYVMDPRKPIFAVRPGASGDISLTDEETSNEYIVWCQKQAAPYNPSTVTVGDFLYVLLDRGFLACYDRVTGAEVFDKQRIPNGLSFTSSPWAAAGKVFCLNEDGTTFVFEAGPEFKLLHTNKLADDDMCMATPALAGDRLILRTAARVYCVAAGD